MLQANSFILSTSLSHYNVIAYTYLYIYVCVCAVYNASKSLYMKFVHPALICHLVLVLFFFFCALLFGYFFATKSRFRPYEAVDTLAVFSVDNDMVSCFVLHTKLPNITDIYKCIQIYVFIYI